MKLKILSVFVIMLIMCPAASAYAASVEMTNKSVIVTNASADDTLIVALYENNRLVECKSYNGLGTYSKNYVEDMSSSFNTADEVKAFLWDMKTIKPVCTAFSSAKDELPPDKNEYKIRLTAGGQEFTATLYKNSTTNAIIDKLPLTLPMMDLYGNEMCYRFPEALPTDDARTQGYEVGEIMYWPPGHSFVIRYAQNGERFEMQKLGKLDSGLEFFQSCGDVDVKIELIANN